MYDVGFADANNKYTCLKKIDNPIVTTKTAILPKLFFLRGLKRQSSSRPPKTPHNKILKITEVIKLIPNGENLSRYNKLESGEDEKREPLLLQKQLFHHEQNLQF